MMPNLSELATSSPEKIAFSSCICVCIALKVRSV